MTRSQRAASSVAGKPLIAASAISVVVFEVMFWLPREARLSLSAQLFAGFVFAAWLVAFTRWGGALSREVQRSNPDKTLRFGAGWPLLILIPGMGGVLCGFALRDLALKARGEANPALRRWSTALWVTAGLANLTISDWILSLLHRALGFRFFATPQPASPIWWAAMQICLVSCVWQLERSRESASRAPNEEQAEARGTDG
ncbi:MAG: hypothetical protein AB7K71_17950 [Polyangiaceae bacterium]